MQHKKSYEHINKKKEKRSKKERETAYDDGDVVYARWKIMMHPVGPDFMPMWAPFTCRLPDALHAVQFANPLDRLRAASHVPGNRRDGLP